MDQIKIGMFIKELRKERGLTQEQFAEEFGVSRRTVSRWETGSNMPDIDILLEISDLCDVELREIFDGERKCDAMNKELEETVMKAAEYSNTEKTKTARVVLIYLIVGLIGLVANAVLDVLQVTGGFWAGFLKGGTLGLALCAILCAILYVTGYLTKLGCAKKRILGKTEQ